MKKFFALAFVFALAVSFAVPAMATQSRVNALADGGVYLEDDYNIFTFPATLVNYSNKVWINMNLYDYSLYGDCDAAYPYCDDIQVMMGGSYGMGEDNAYGVLALFFYRHTQGLGAVPQWLDLEVDEFAPAMWWIDNKLSILYAYGAEGWSFGLGFEHASEHSQGEGGGETFDMPKVAMYKINASVRFDVGESMYSDIAFNFGTYSYTDDDFEDGDYGTVEADANMTFGIQARGFWEKNEYLTLVPFIKYSSFDYSLKADSAQAFKDDYWGMKGMMFDIGIGANIAVNEDNLLLFAIDIYDYGKFEPSDQPEGEQYEGSYSVFPRFRLGLESDVRDWLTFRAGCMKNLVKYSEKYTDSEDADNNWEGFDTAGDFWFWLGLGFHVGDFDIDCLVNNNLPFRLGYWLTGFGGGSYEGVQDAPIIQISGKYHF